MSENLRETNADQEQRTQAAGDVTTILVAVDVLGQLDWGRGFQYRNMRPATAEQMRVALEAMEGQK